MTCHEHRFNEGWDDVSDDDDDYDDSVTPPKIN